MRSWVLTVVGLVLTVAGVIWALQGFGEIGGSFMSGNSVWAVIGPLVAAAGLGATRAPAAASGLAATGVRFHTVTSWPSPSRRPAIGAPINPSPRKATVATGVHRNRPV